MVRQYDIPNIWYSEYSAKKKKTDDIKNINIFYNFHMLGPTSSDVKNIDIFLLLIMVLLWPWSILFPGKACIYNGS